MNFFLPKPGPLPSDFPEKRYNNMSSKLSCISSASQVNVRSNILRSQTPALSTCTNDSTITPIAKEIENRLEVINRLVPQEEVVKISENIIGQLNAVCYEKLKDQVLGSGSRAPSVYSVASNKTSHRSQVVNGRLNNDRTQLAEDRIFRAAKTVGEEKQQLFPIIEESHKRGKDFSLMSEKGSIRGKKKTATKKPPAPMDDDSLCFRKPSNVGRNKTKKTAPQSVKTVSKRKNYLLEESVVSASSADLTITKNSLRSHVTKKASGEKKQKLTPVRIRNEDSNASSENELIPELKNDEMPLLSAIQKQPKKTALSPFFNRFTKRCAMNSSTPMKEKIEYFNGLSDNGIVS